MDTSKVLVPPKAGHTTVRVFFQGMQHGTWKQKY